MANAAGVQHAPEAASCSSRIVKSWPLALLLACVLPPVQAISVYDNAPPYLSDLLQAEAAAQLAVCQGRMCQLLASISSDITSSSSALQQLAEVLFESPMNVCELVDQGGVGVMVAAARSAVEELAAEHNKKQMLPALLQVCQVRERQQVAAGMH